MKRKFIGLILCFTLFSMSILTGCSLFTRNTKMYYDTVVATVEKDGKTINITKKELIETYSSYGAMYEQYYDYTIKEAYDMSLTLLENKKITIEEAKSLYNISDDGQGLSDKEKDYLWKETIDALFDNLDSYYSDIVGEETTEEESESVTFEGYSKNAKIENGVIKKTSVAKKVIDEYDYDASNAHDYSNKEDKDYIYTSFVKFVTSENENYQKAFEQYRQDLITSEKGLNLSTNTVELFAREIDRLANLMFENYLIELYGEYYQDYSDVSSVTINDVLQLYSSKVRKGYVQYVIEQDSSYDENMQKNPSSVYYYKNDNETKYFTVANILVKFDDEQQETYNELYEKFYGQSPDDGDAPEVGDMGYDGSYSKTQYEADLNELYGSLEYIVREPDSKGEVYTEKGRVADLDGLWTTISTQLKNAKDDSQRASLIKDYIYLYGEDTGMINAESMYVVGVDSEGNAVSSFVDPFNDAAIELYNNGNAKFGDVSQFVRTSYGLHILIYTGVAENPNIVKLQEAVNENVVFEYEEGDEYNADSAIYILYNTKINPIVDKTYFDVLYDELYEDSSTLESEKLQSAKNQYTITHYESRYADLV